MRPNLGIAAFAGLIAAAPAVAQTPMQYVQQMQAIGLSSRLASPPSAAADVQSAQTLVGGSGGVVTNRAGTTTQSEGGPIVSGPLGDDNRAAGTTAVFGASLFTREATAVSDAPNPNYVLVPGDRVSVRVWGAVEAEVVGQVDPSGMLFLPNIGPVRVAGTRAGDLQAAVQSEVQKVYTNQVQAYATLL